MGVEKVNTPNLCRTYGPKNVIEAPVYSKNLEKPRVIDLKLTNHPLSFLNSCVVETGLSEFQKMVLLVFKMT